jgi:hypothetical protein
MALGRHECARWLEVPVVGGAGDGPQPSGLEAVVAGAEPPEVLGLGAATVFEGDDVVVLEAEVGVAAVRAADRVPGVEPVGQPLRLVAAGRGARRQVLDVEGDGADLRLREHLRRDRSGDRSDAGDLAAVRAHHQARRRRICRAVGDQAVERVCCIRVARFTDPGAIRLLEDAVGLGLDRDLHRRALVGRHAPHARGCTVGFHPHPE